MTVRQCTEGRANSKVSLYSAAGYTIAAEGKFAIIYNSTTVICKFAKKLQFKFQKNMTINMVNNIIIHISNWFHEME